MKHINIAMEKMDNGTVVKDEENLSIIERIVQKTGNPKIAAVLALDLFLVGVDTVSKPISYTLNDKWDLVFASPWRWSWSD